ncbi:TonB-dependent receptor [Marinomonas sp. C2222]|uniref:TonB-dependent receptor n=1 Tax=Marinomonas sargassi TaxID=2984494 RepID=A0ABT2YV25_9GAMM|nr:TonB-dependent receptor [Marinomonas sargassi]MCV2403750.1 TonB-dependent receptor [Marinomonas sargassi]
MRSNVTFKKSLLALAIVQATAMSSMALAEDTVLLDELKVEGRAITELDQEITAEDIEKSQATDLKGLFQNKSEVTAGGSVNIGQKIYVRNLGEDSLNITVDGAEQSGGVFHHAGRITIEPELLKRVEVEAGAANATSGPGALGGSIRFVTKDASDLLDDDQNVGALLKSTFSSNGEGLKNSATVYGRTESGKTEGMLHILDSSHDNYDDGEGNELEGTELDESLGFVKVKTQLTEEQGLSVSYESLKKAGDMTYKPEWAYNTTLTNKNPLSDSESTRKTTTVNYNFTDSESDLIDTQVTLYKTRNDLDSVDGSDNITGFVETVGVTLQNTSILDQHELTYGLNHREDESNYNNSSNTETGTVTGLYLQDSIDVNKKLTISTGVRYDQYDLDDVNNQQLKDSDVSPNIGAVIYLTDQLNLTANYSKAIRGPEIKDAYKISAGVSNSDDLTAETATNTEIGINYKKGSFSVSGGVYESVIEDAIGTETPWGKAYTNLEEDIETTGFYIDISYQLERLAAGLHFHSADTMQGDQIVTRYTHSSTATSIGDTLVLSLDYQMSQTFEAGWSAEFVKGIHDIEQSVSTYTLTLDKPGYATHNIYAKWLPLGDDQLTVALTINNLFDKQYLSHASMEDYNGNSGWEGIVGTAATGRDIRLSAALKF